MKRYRYLFLGAVFLTGWTHGAEKVEDTVTTHKPIEIDATSVMIKKPQESSSEKPASNQPQAPALDSYGTHVVPIQQEPNKLPGKKPKITKPDDGAVEPGEAPSQDHASDRPASVKQVPELVTVPGDNLSGRQDAIQDANQARIADEARQAADALRELSGDDSLGGTDPDLGLGGSGTTGPDGREVDYSDLPGHDVAGFEPPEGSEYLPDLPSNEDQGPSSSVFRPSGDFRGIMGGAASQESGVVQLEEQHMQGDKETHRQRNPNGSTTTTTVRTYGDGSERVDQETVDPGGQVRYRRQILIDREGNVTSDRSRSWFADGDRESRWQRGPLDPRGTQDPDSPNYSPEFARWASQFDHSKKQGARNPNRVNPGPEGAVENPQAPRLNLGEQIVINPSTENAGGQARELSEEQRRAMGQQLLEEVKGPGGHPGDSPDGQVEASIEETQTQ